MRRRGVGKELLSQAIHNESERAGGPYIAVNCQLYADSVLGQDFMGSAPTDDENGRLSRLELANGGTLFLEKIEYLAPELQSALLQVIKQGVLTRLDARRLIPVDVKVIATTTVDLAIWWNRTALAASCTMRCTPLRSSSRRCAPTQQYSVAGA